MKFALTCPRYTPPNSTNTVTSTTSTATSSSATPTSPIHVPGNINFTLLGCYNEPSGGRALSTLALATDLMTVELCLSTCWNYKYVGVEYSRYSSLPF